MPPRELQPQVQVQGWAVGGKRARGLEDAQGHGRGAAASGPTAYMHELRQRLRLAVMARGNLMHFPNLLLVKHNPPNLSVSTFLSHKMGILNLTCFTALMGG